MSFVGMFVLIGIAILLSRNRKAIRLRTVIGAFALQLILGAFVLYSSFGKQALHSVSLGVGQVIDFGNDGIDFLFGNVTRAPVNTVQYREVLSWYGDIVELEQNLKSLDYVQSIEQLSSDSAINSRPKLGSIDLLHKDIKLRVNLDFNLESSDERIDVEWLIDNVIKKELIADSSDVHLSYLSPTEFTRVKLLERVNSFG